MFKRSFLFNLLIIALLVIGLLYLFFNSLDFLTNHGKQTSVPSLMGKSMSAAVKELKGMGFRIEIDSTYQSYKSPLEVLYQEPEAGMAVKVGRTIFLTVNRKTPPSIEMPNLVNMSFRNALLTMRSYNLEMGDTTYRPDVAAGAVLEQWVKGKQIAPGAMVPFGSQIDLVIGEGLSGEQEVPNLIGMSWAEARDLIASLSLTSNTVWEGAISDSNSAIIYMQQPEAVNELDFRNMIPEGDIIDIRIMQNPSQELLTKNQPGSKKLIGEEGVTDSNEVPIDNIPTPKKEIPDSLKKKKRVPGMDVHTMPSEEIKGAKNNNKLDNTKGKNSNVIAGDKLKSKPKPKAKPKPKTETKPAPEKSNQIKDEFN